MIKTAKMSQFENSIVDCGNDSSKMWRQLNSLGQKDPKGENSIVLENLMNGDVVKIISGDRIGSLAVVKETNEFLKSLKEHDEIEIRYLKKSLGKWIQTNLDLDSRLPKALKKVVYSVDKRSRYSVYDD